MSREQVPRVTAPYGGWLSPITPELINRGAPARDFPCLVDDVAYWQESRPEENGRITIVARYPDGNEWDLLPYPFSARSKVHEYGGRAWTVAQQTLYFVNQQDQRLYALPLASAYEDVVPLTPEGGASRFADLVFDPHRQRLLAVMEEHHQAEPGQSQREPDQREPGEKDHDREEHGQGAREPLNSLVAITPPTGATAGPARVETLVSGADFYAFPRLSPDGSRLCWLSWNHPNMPWDGTELWYADLDGDGLPLALVRAAGGEEEAIFQPGWSPSGELVFISDSSGWWNLYRHHPEGNHCLLPMEADFATPLWSLGMSTWGFVDDRRIAALLTRDGTWQVGILDTASGGFSLLASPYTQLSGLSTAPGRAILCAGNARLPDDIAVLDLTAGSLDTLKSSASPAFDEYLSLPRAIRFETGDGDTAHGFYYPPHSPDFTGPKGKLPPLIVMCHGGPTGAASTALNLKIQFWTSRGFAVFDVNYRGSTGFGRAYREKLNGRWGEADVADAVAAVRHLGEHGLVDSRRAIIRGSSAGGFTALAALTFSDSFRAGASLYGIGDLETLARDTHKFEARYLDRLVGPYPERRDLYRQRSPIHHSEQLRCPVIFMQGLEDKVVPPGQAEAMVAALRDRGVPVAYITFADEAHGFRKAPNIKKALEAELAFYRRILHIASDERLPAVTIENF
ncbi:MAG: S9 family peptidase [Bacteroidales bacterium]|nr:S9 family peptidase [Bacteroidales bacterium]